MNNLEKFIVNPDIEIFSVDNGSVIFEKDMKHICYIDSNASKIISLFSEEMDIVQLRKKAEEAFSNVNDSEFSVFIEECIAAQIIIPANQNDKRFV